MELHKHFKLNPMLRYVTVILFIATTTVQASIEASGVMPHGGVNYKVFDVLEDKFFDLVCKSPSKVHWTKDGKELSSIATFKDEHGIRYEFKDDGKTLTIKRPAFEDDGKYVCKNAENEQAEISVIANVYIKKMPENLSVVEGEKLKIQCHVWGTDPEIKWTAAIETKQEEHKANKPQGAEVGPYDEMVYVPIDDNFESIGRVSLQSYENIEKGTFIMNATVLEDRGRYNCTAWNMAYTLNSEKYKPVERGCYVRVKGKLAALWPFLGICAEVLILCAIILVYEKRRNKEGMDESDTDQSPEQEKLKTGK